jgi:hypothetical protein
MMDHRNPFPIYIHVTDKRARSMTRRLLPRHVAGMRKMNKQQYESSNECATSHERLKLLEMFSLMQ